MVKKFYLCKKHRTLTVEQEQIAELKQQVLLLTRRIGELEKENAKLKKALSTYQIKKNSSNSSLPPSHDLNRVRRTESLRVKTGRKPGGQIGHEGFILKQLEPTEIIEHQPQYCQCCGKDLSEEPANFIGKRQSIDIPPISPIITEHQFFSKQCSCGHITQGVYPMDVPSFVCYGRNIQALTAYFHARQYISYERMQEMYADVFGLQISAGSLVNMVQTFAKKATGVYKTIRQQVARSIVVGGDETGTCIKGKNAWAWVFQSEHATYIHCDKSRGKAVIDALFPQGFPFSILVHDCWKSYFGTVAKGHQICIAHLQRELKYLGKLYPKQKWVEKITALIGQALDLKKIMLPENYSQSFPKRTELEEQLDALLKQTISPKQEKLVTFKERIVRYRNYLFTFLYHPQTPPDNNASERAVRNFKVKQKVSGLFRSDEGAKDFAIIRSVIDTTMKNTRNVMEALKLITFIPTVE